VSATVLSLAWRNLWRNRRRTLINMSAIGFGLFLVIFYSGLIAGVLGEAKNQLDNGGLGHAEVFPAGYRPKRLASVTMPDAAQWASKVKLPAGAEVGSRVLARGLATSAHGSEAVELFGVDWEAERQLAAHLRGLRQGGLPAADDARGVLVGEKLAERLRLKVGSKVRVMAQRADGEVGADLFRVRGVFHSLSPALSRRQVYVSMSAARTLLGLGEVSHQLVIQLPDPEQADAVAEQVRGALGAGYEVRSWGELLPVLRRMEGLTRSIVAAISVFVYLLVGLGVLNTMLMSVLERTREFGVLLALGTRPRRIVALVLAESFWVATLSVLLGAAAGALATWYFSHEAITLFAKVGESFELEGVSLATAFKTRFAMGDLLQAASYVYVMALVVGLYPASRISRLQPAEALRRS
jgi:ABC-type lipoprotein release transport system permease subunit